MDSSRIRILVRRNITSVPLQDKMLKKVDSIPNQIRGLDYSDFIEYLLNEICQMYMEKEDWKHQYNKLMESFEGGDPNIRRKHGTRPRAAANA